MDLTLIFNHLGYVFCFWAVWKGLDVAWTLLRIEAFINTVLQRESDVERQVAGKLSYFNKLWEKADKTRQTEETKLKNLINELGQRIIELNKKITPGMDDNLRSTVYGLYERLKLATDGLKFDHELAKEVEKLRKKIHELNKLVPSEPPCYLPVNPNAPKEGQLKKSESGTGMILVYNGKDWVPAKGVFEEVEGVLVEKEPDKKKKAAKKTSVAVKNPYIPQSLATVRGAHVAAKTNIKQGSLGEELKYALPYQAMLDNLKEEEANLTGSTNASRNRTPVKKA